MSHSHLLPSQSAGKFIFGGKAIFTVRDAVTGTRYTYKVVENKQKTMYFINGLTGSDNNSNYSYLGVVIKENRSFRHTAKSRVSETAPIFATFNVLFNTMKFGRLTAATEIWHEGRCGRCGRLLTVPESIQSGFGPECVHLAFKK